MIASIDVGYSNTKIALQEPGGSAGQTLMAYPSGAGPMALASKTIGGGVDLSGGVHVVIDGVDYVGLTNPRNIGQTVRPLHARYTESIEYRVLFLAALAKIGAARINYLVTGLPVAQAQDKRFREALEAQLTGTHEIRPGVRVSVDRVKVLPQPAGAWFSHMFANPRYQRPDVQAMVLDIGFYSADYVMISDGKIVDSSSGSSYFATSKVIEEAVAIIKRMRGIGVSVERLEAAVRCGADTLTLGDREVEIAPLMREAAKPCAKNVMSDIQRVLRTEADQPTLFVLAGGGAQYYADALREAMPKTTTIAMVANPVTANASGFLRFGQI